MNTKYFTGEGDNGKIHFDGKEISKSSLYAETIGSLDEVTSWLGIARTEINNEFVLNAIKEIQESLFIIQAEIGALGFNHKPSKTISVEKVKNLELIIQKIDEEIPEITHFVIPGGSKGSAVLDFSRALARRAERKIVEFSEKKNISDELFQFINRLSSILFALARYINYKEGIKEQQPDYR